MIIKLSNAEVTIKDHLTWGDNEKIQQAIMSGAKMTGKVDSDIGLDFSPTSLLEAKYVAMECAVISIKENDKEIAFTRDWVNNLTISDGNTLYEAIDNLSKKK